MKYYKRGCFKDTILWGTEPDDDDTIDTIFLSILTTFQPGTR